MNLTTDQQMLVIRALLLIGDRDGILLAGALADEWTGEGVDMPIAGLGRLIQQQRDLGTMLVCAVRYSLGRQSYMPSHVAELVHRYWDDLSANDRNVIRTDVARALDDYNRNLRSLGMECDVETWQQLARQLAKKEPVR